MATFVHVTCSGMKLTNNYKMGGRDLSADVYRILRSNTFPCAFKQLFCPHHGTCFAHFLMGVIGLGGGEVHFLN